MKASYRVAILACAAWGCIVACSVVRADFLQASANSSSVGVSLTLGIGTFSLMPVPTYTGQATAAVQVKSQSQNVAPFNNLYAPISAGPLQINDPSTVTTVEADASQTGVLTNGGQTLTVTGSANSSASSAFSASAASGVGIIGTQGVRLVLASPTTAVFDIDLMSDFGTSPNSAYSLQTFASGALSSSHWAVAEIGTVVTSNLSSALNVFTLGVTESWSNGVPSLNVQFGSSLIAQPIFASDFVASPDGTFSLDPSKRHIAIPITIPANYGFQYFLNSSSSIQVVPEPSTLALAALGFLALAALRWRRR